MKGALCVYSMRGRNDNKSSKLEKSVGWKSVNQPFIVHG